MPDVGGAITGAVSLFSANEASESADAADQLRYEQLQIERERDEFNRDQIERMNRWTAADRRDFRQRRRRERRLLDPVQEGLVERAMEGPDFEGAMARSDADVAQAYGLQRDQMQRYNQRYGVNPSSGRQAWTNLRVGNAEALARVHGRNRARLQEDDRDWARKVAALGTGNMRNAQPSAQLAQLGVSGASGVYDRMAANEALNAQGAYELSGKLFADTMDRFDNRPTESSVTPITNDSSGYGGAWYPGVT
jgi:hypothetical protein